MRPILYPESETNFTTNGLGRLNPLMCHVTKERNGQYDLEMDIRIDDRHYADLKEYRIIYAPEERRWEDFYGFNGGGRWKVSFTAMMIGAFLISMGLMGLQNI